MAHSSLRFIGLATGLAFSLAAACNRNSGTPDPGGNANYGADYIGYKNSTESILEGADSGSLTGATSGDGSSAFESDGYVDTGTGGTGYAAGGAAATGGTTLGEGGTSYGMQSWTGPERGPTPAENPFFTASEDSTSTFSIDVDTGSYTLARNAISDGALPDKESVRIEEFLNYFHFHYAEPRDDKPLSLYTEISSCPWNDDREMLLLGVQGEELAVEDQPAMNLVFLLDVSGSMSSSEKLPLLKRGFRMLARQLRPEDRVSIVTYAGNESVVLDGVPGNANERIDQALANLEAGGSTNGEGGIQKAYELAQRHFIEGGTNRVLLGTDGDFNVGLSETSELTEFIAKKRKTGVFLSVYGFGDAHFGGNYQDEVAEQLADNGNGVYFFIDSEEEARRAFIHTVSGSLVTVAKDVKLQVEFNPRHVKGYRLIGYENRVLSNSAFSDDSVDAGELGAGLSVTALYEIIPADSNESIPQPEEGTVPDTVLAAEADTSEGEAFPELGAKDYVSVRLRYKLSDSDESDLMTVTRGTDQRRHEPSHKMSFAAGIVEFASLLRGSQYLTRERDGELVDQIARTRSLDREGAIAESQQMLERALSLAN